MLPDISIRRKLYGIDRKHYDERQLHAILDMKNHDNCTTNNCVGIVRRMNKYFEDSRYIVVETSTIFYCMRAMMDGEFDGADCEVLRLYEENIDRGLLASSMRNVMNVTQSIAAQRRLIKSVKPVIKKNRLNRDWEELLNTLMDDLEKRMKYVTEIVIPANVQNTPMGAYMDYLSNMGVDILEDIRLYIDNNGSIFDSDDKSVQVYKDHVLQILCNLDDEMAERLVEKARAGMEARRKRIEKIRTEEEAEKAAKTAAKMEECRAIVLQLCSIAGKTFRKMRKDSLIRYSIRNSEIWVVAAAQAKPMRTGYLRRAGSGKFGISNAGYASFFRSQEEARNAADTFCRSGANRVAEIAKVELYAYGIGI